MRLVKISAPEGKGRDVAKIAFSVGIKQVSVHQVNILQENGDSKIKEAVDIETSTPRAKHFIDSLLAAKFFNRKDYSIAVRQPRSIISQESLRELTVPLVEPSTDILEEFWQFSHITAGFVGRIFIAACLLAFGLIHEQILTTIAGLLFLPLLPLLLGFGFGALQRDWKLLLQSAAAFMTAIILLILGGALIAAVSSPPLRYDEFNLLPIGFLISLAVGIAAGLASIDDVGRRELIGLAATAQIAIVPVWFGICFVFGFPSTTAKDEIIKRSLGFGLNVLTIMASSLLTYVIFGAAKRLNLEKS